MEKDSKNCVYSTLNYTPPPQRSCRKGCCYPNNGSLDVFQTWHLGTIWDSTPFEKISLLSFQANVTRRGVQFQ